jgi:hypothetical protein
LGPGIPSQRQQFAATQRKYQRAPSLGRKTARIIGASQFWREAAKQRTKEKYRRIKAMAPRGGISLNPAYTMN